MIEVIDLKYGYDNKTLGLKGANLSIKKGSKVGIIGANGSGKSTFLKCLSGILSPLSGEIRYEGKVMKPKELRKKIGFVFQEADHQIIGTTVKQEVCFGLMNQKFSREIVDQRSRYALEYMGLESFEERLTFQLSGGEKKRLTIADMIAMEHEVILLDEPTVALDFPHLQMFSKSLEQLLSDGKTICVSSHDMDFLYEWADQLVVFKEGKIIFVGKPREVFSQSTLVLEAKVSTPKVVQMYQEYFGKENGVMIPQNIKELITMIHQQEGE